MRPFTIDDFDEMAHVFSNVHASTSERFAYPNDPTHDCSRCPIDPHTVNRMLSSLDGVLEATLTLVSRAAQDTDLRYISMLLEKIDKYLEVQSFLVICFEPSSIPTHRDRLEALLSSFRGICTCDDDDHAGPHTKE